MKMAFRYFVLKEQLFKRNISLTAFAKALEVSVPVLSGKGAPFPMEKLEQAIELLNNWPGPTKLRRSQQLKPADTLLPVTKEMLVD